MKRFVEWRFFSLMMYICFMQTVVGVIPQTVYAVADAPKSVIFTLYDNKGAEIAGFEEGVGGITFTALGTGVDAEGVVALCYAFYKADKHLIKADITTIEVNDSGAFELTAQDEFRVNEVPKNAVALKLFAFESLDTISPFVKCREVPSRSMEAEKVAFDSDILYYSVVLAENEAACMSVPALAAATGGTANGNSISWGDALVEFEEGNRLAKYGDGHLMLQCEPFSNGKQMYVPVSVLEPVNCWAVYYDRFNKYMEIKTGTDYPSDEPTVFKASDYGAKGDGVTDDGVAITAAIYTAMTSGKPSKVLLEPNCTYMVGERADSMSYFTIDGVENLILDGQGSEIVFKNCTNTFLQITNCKNIKIQNLDFDYCEPPYTQGTITAVHGPNNASIAEGFDIKIAVGYPSPASDKWVKYYYQNARTGGWWFGKLFESDKDIMKFVKYNYFMIDSVQRLEEERTYRVFLGSASTYWSQFIEVGDRFAINTRFSSYDIGDTTHEGSTSAVMIMYSADITLENVNLYAAPWLGVEVGLNTGRINFINFGEETRNGRLLCVNSDGIHCYRNKEGITVKNCTFMSSLDDQINTKGEDAVITQKMNNTTFVVDYDLNFRVGDKLILFDTSLRKVLGTAYLKEFAESSTGIRLVLDREISEASVGHIIYDADSSTSGSVISGNTFRDSRRHAYVTRSENSIFENNDIINCGGAALSASNEIMPESSEGPFPSSFTMRNNRISSLRNTHGSYPIEVMSWKAENGDSKAIDGFLIESNIVDVPICDYDKHTFATDKNVVTSIRINSVDNLYMINNIITSTAQNDVTQYHVMPVYINNSTVRMIDGLYSNFATQSENGAVITLDSCVFDTECVKNVKDLSGRNEEMYANQRKSTDLE